ncbi:MAG TPA: sulfite oxidase-like oxidoreductase [Chthoniobacterales bacterium]
MSLSITERKERWARKMAGQGHRSVRSVDRLPPGQHLTAGFPVLDLGVRPQVPLDEWTLELTGEVEHPVSLSWRELQDLPQFHDVSDFHCVTTWSKFDCQWSGVAFFTLLDLVRPRPGTRFLFVVGYDGYTTNVPLEPCMDEDVLIATAFKGTPISLEHGGPARMIIPKLYAWKGAKFVRSIEFRSTDIRGYWENRGYSDVGDPWTEDRFSG